MSIPIAASPGRSGFGPQLALSYDSGAGNGPFGFGWNLSIPSITRKTDKGLPLYEDADESDVFILSGAEDLVPVMDDKGQRWEKTREVLGVTYRLHRYRPRIEGLFARIERWTRVDSGDAHWRSITRDNVTSIYGQAVDSRIADPDDPLRRVFSWLICASHDDKGNAILYTYKEENADGVVLSDVHEKNRTDAGRAANRYLKSIQYGNRISRLVQPDLAKPDWMFQLVFDYGEHDARNPTPADSGSWLCRHDPFSSYRAGFEVRTYRLCQRVLMFHHFPDEKDVGDHCLVRSTDLIYRNTRNNPDDLKRGHPIASFVASVTQRGYKRRADGTYLAKALPPVEFEYSDAVIQSEVREFDADSVENLPIGLDGRSYQWVDLDGEALSGILAQHGDAWLYKPNLGGGAFGALEVVARQPSLAAPGGRRQELLDLAGDGTLDFVDLDAPLPGFYERTEDASWESYRPFDAWPNISLGDPNLRLVDLTGDGHADILIAGDEVLSWAPSLGEAGFGPLERRSQSVDEEQGPRLVFAGGEESIYLADVSGDGLADLVRLQNGEVCYWPNLGYGRFGAKITMDNSPWFDAPDQFGQNRIRLADIDGSGTTDIIYLGRDGVRVYLNQSGNRWSDPETLPQFPHLDDVSSVQVADLLGNGTACIVWSSPLPVDAGRPVRYVDLMGGLKPHLLITLRNNLGAESHVTYASSTKFYVADKLAGRPWVTRLPFPVHVVERVDTIDSVSGNRFVTRYEYHDGYFDGVEREFRGFGQVDQWDTEAFAALTKDHALPAATNIDASSHVPPVKTRTWFHTGAEELLTDNTVLPPGSSPDEAREACRALKGSMLRQEVYAEDGSSKRPHPYTVTEQRISVSRVQPKRANRHAVFFTHALESLGYHYERNPDDPRISHALTLDVDPFGNVLKSAAVAYGRLTPDPELEMLDQARQGGTLITYTENSVTNAVDEDDDYRAPVSCETVTYELTGYMPSGAEGRFKTTDFVAPAKDGAVVHLFDGEIAYEETPGNGRTRRPIERLRTFFRPGDCGVAQKDSLALLPLGQLQPLGLPGESYRLAFTSGLLKVLPLGDPGSVLGVDGGYVDLDKNGCWWIPSGRTFYSPNAGDDPAAELAYATVHFFLAHRFRDPFHTAQTSTETVVRYDKYDLLIEETRDSLGNRVTAGERDVDPAKALTKRGHDYRVLQPALVMDPNRNRAAVALDALGMVVGTAVMGKPEDKPALGDSLDTFVADLDDAIVKTHLADPLKGPHAILGTATTRLVYDLTQQPAVVYTLARETHQSNLAADEKTKVQHSFSYSDGFGREIQKKIQAEPSPDMNPRWVGSGWTIFNNKGKPVRQYEPFFTKTHRFQFNVAGVSPVIFYDPVERVVATLHPNCTWEKVVFDPWRQESSDVNDTSTSGDPKADPDVGEFFARLPDADYLPTWYDQRAGGALGPEEQDVAQKTAVHAGTPSVAHFDVLGRTFLAIVHNRFKYTNAPAADPPVKELHATRVTFDIEGNQRAVTDARNRIVMRDDYDMLGTRIHQASMEAGERWMLNDAAGKPIRAWDSREHTFRTKYDPLRRPTDVFLADSNAPEACIGRTVYGESADNPEASNLRGKVLQVFDQAGVVIADEYDFKGNARVSKRQLAHEYKTTLGWPAASLDAGIFVSQTFYDALNRPIAVTAPDGSIVRPGYNEANLLETVSVHLPGAKHATPFVTNIDYDAKGQRTRIDYGNGVETTYEYDPLTFRLVHLQTVRSAADVLQDLHYTYDPAGNIVRIGDQAQQTIFFRNQQVEPSAAYLYDATYRLIEATGREHLGRMGGTPNPPTAPDAFNAFQTRFDHPGDGLAMGTYLERYVYDFVGNILSVQHRGSDPVHPGWARSFDYEEVSLLDPNAFNNRLTRTSIGDVIETYSYAGSAGLHGSITAMPHLPVMQWDYHDQLQATAKQTVNDGGTPETTWYVYDAGGQRVRKVTERQADAGKTPTRLRETIYLGGFEIYREYDTGGTVTLERETLHVMDDKKRIALVETRTQGSDPSPQRLIRYQFSNHLGSSSLELDDNAQIVSYEEYFPYGSTSDQAVRSQTETPKRYRYTGKERDESSGFSYHRARYYCPWIGRWASCDPIGLQDGSNLYRYAQSNPVAWTDDTGTSSQPAKPERPQLWLGEQRKFTIKPVATRSGRGITPRQHLALKGIDHGFGPGTGMDWGHPKGQPHGVTPAGRRPPLRPQPQSENRSSFGDKLAKRDAAAQKQFVRDKLGIDRTVKPGTKFQQPTPEPFEQPLADYAGSIKPPSAPVSKPPNTSTPAPPSSSPAASHEQLSLEFQHARSSSGSAVPKSIEPSVPAKPAAVVAKPAPVAAEPNPAVAAEAGAGEASAAEARVGLRSAFRTGSYVFGGALVVVGVVSVLASDAPPEEKGAGLFLIALEVAVPATAILTMFISSATAPPAPPPGGAGSGASGMSAANPYGDPPYR